MILYLCRHGSAEDLSATGRDADRALTDEGRSKFRKVARGFADLDPEIRVIFTSPLLRACQTAEILCDILTKHTTTAPKLTILPALGLGASWKAVRTTLQNIPNPEAQIVAVGHEPFLSELVYDLCLKAEKSPPTSPITPGGGVEFKKGGMAALRLNPDLTAGTLLWLAPPGMMRKL